MKKEECQNALNDIINNCKGFKCKNDSFWIIQELIDEHFKNKELLKG